MTTTNHALVAGVFTNEDRAHQAMTDLHNAGLTDDEIRYSVHRGGSGIADALVKLGFTQEEADHYNQEFLGGRTIVTVNAPDRRREDASCILSLIDDATTQGSRDDEACFWLPIACDRTHYLPNYSESFQAQDAQKYCVVYVNRRHAECWLFRTSRAKLCNSDLLTFLHPP